MKLLVTAGWEDSNGEWVENSDVLTIETGMYTDLARFIETHFERERPRTTTAQEVQQVIDIRKA